MISFYLVNYVDYVDCVDCVDCVDWLIMLNKTNHLKPEVTKQGMKKKIYLAALLKKG
jgi:hypothetical protein